MDWIGVRSMGWGKIFRGVLASTIHDTHTHTTNRRRTPLSSASRTFSPSFSTATIFTCVLVRYPYLPASQVIYDTVYGWAAWDCQSASRGGVGGRGRASGTTGASDRSFWPHGDQTITTQQQFRAEKTMDSQPELLYRAEIAQVHVGRPRGRERRRRRRLRRPGGRRTLHCRLCVCVCVIVKGFAGGGGGGRVLSSACCLETSNPQEQAGRQAYASTHFAVPRTRPAPRAPRSGSGAGRARGHTSREKAARSVCMWGFGVWRFGGLGWGGLVCVCVEGSE